MLTRACCCAVLPVLSAIAEAREFLLAHGVHYAAGSTNVEPDVDVSAAIANRVSAAHGSGDRPAAASVHAPQADGRMDDEEKQQDTDSSQSQQAHRAAPHEHAKQLQAFLDDIPEQ